MKRKFILYILLLNFSALTALGQNQHLSDNDSLKLDIKPIVIKEFDGDLKQEYTGSNFNYIEGTGETENFLTRAVNWFFDGLRDLFGIDVDPDTQQLIETIIYVALIALGLFFMIRLLLGKQATSFLSGNSKTLAPIQISEEDITRIDLDALIKDALAINDYRLAVRYMYLKVLKQLSFKELISWHFEKTNSDYYNEISNVTIKEGFSKVSYLYDYIWYGEFALDASGFNKAKVVFESLNSNINRHG